MEVSLKYTLKCVQESAKKKGKELVGTEGQYNQSS